MEYSLFTEYYAAIKMNEVDLHIPKWKDLYNIELKSEIQVTFSGIPFCTELCI